MGTTGVFLETLTWREAEAWLTPERSVVIPLGAAAKEHGLHLPLDNDARIANWLAKRVCEQIEVVVAPLINAHFYPAFVEYPGSISLRESTATELLVDICRSLAAYGPRRFYVLNTGVSTVGPLQAAADVVRQDDCILRYSALDRVYAQLPDGMFQQSFGSHADERETSLMLHIAPETVDMSQAVADGVDGTGRLSRVRGEGTWSASGVYGDATLATAAKGERLAELMVSTVCQEIENLSRLELMA
ncbi:MAG: creatininase family protein [Pseudomonadota bacterium]